MMSRYRKLFLPTPRPSICSTARTSAGCGRSLSLMLLGRWLGFRDTLPGTWSTKCQWCRSSSFWSRTCNMRFFLQAPARPARGRAGDQHAQDPSSTTIVSTSDCCGAADCGAAERRAAESTLWTPLNNTILQGCRHDFCEEL